MQVCSLVPAGYHHCLPAGTPKLPELAQSVDISGLLAAAASVEACCQDTEPWPLWPDARLQQFLCVLAHVSLSAEVLLRLNTPGLCCLMPACSSSCVNCPA